jgi:hypothetical protein
VKILYPRLRSVYWTCLNPGSTAILGQYAENVARPNVGTELANIGPTFRILDRYRIMFPDISQRRRYPAILDQKWADIVCYQGIRCSSLPPSKRRIFLTREVSARYIDVMKYTSRHQHIVYFMTSAHRASLVNEI